MTATLTAPTVDLSKPLPFATFSITASRAAELAAAGQLVPWQGILAVEGVPTGDRRVIELGALRWANLPLPLMAQFENPVGGMGHDGAVLAGRIDDIVRIDENRVWARGFIDPKAPGGATLINALDMGLMRGISVDLDDVTVTQFRDKDGQNRRGITNGRIRGATVTPFQAIVEAEIALDVDALAATGGQPTTGLLARITTPISAEESIIERLASSLVASGKIPTDPPLAFFDKRKFTEYTPFRILPNGHCFGHIAAWGTCHISFRRCEPVPRSGTNYSAFRTGSVLTAEGVEVRTGPLIMDSVHPDLMLRASDTQAFYAHTGSAVADIVPYEDEFGIAVVGAIRPDVTPERLRALRGSDISPDWRTVNGRHRECVAMLAVNNSGFKPPASLVASGARFVMPGGVAAAFDPSGEVMALVASGGALQLDPGCADDTDDVDTPDAAEWRTEALALIVERWGPKVRTFRVATPPKTRAFRCAQFHGGASHDQKSHGRRANAILQQVTGQRGATGKAKSSAPSRPSREEREEGAKLTASSFGPGINHNWDSEAGRLNTYFEYRRNNDTFEVSVNASAFDGEFEVDMVIHNIGGPDGVRARGRGEYTGGDRAGRKAANTWIQNKLHEILDTPDDELGARTRTFRIAQFHQQGQHDQQSHGNRGGHRAIREVASEIRKDWKKVNYAARPYLDAMGQLDSIKDMYYNDDAKSIVLYFLSNAGSWRGETAKRIKQELKDMVAGKPPKGSAMTLDEAKRAAKG